MPDQDLAALRELLWARELDIYAARGRGNLGRYESAITASYLAWPPQHASPIDAVAFARDVRDFPSGGEELLTMTLTGFSADGDSAILYYTTHRTRLPSGQPVDQRFEVVHIWLHRDRDWRLFGGMARAAPHRQPTPTYSRGE